jgi:3-oxoacyl-[acyl-carrier-protein] synthase III
MALAALRALADKAGITPGDVGLIAVCTQNPDGGGLPHVSAAVHAEWGGVEGAMVFDLSHGCAGYVYGLAIVDALMTTQGIEHGVLITADPYSKIVDPDDKNTALLFGDAASATLLGPAAPGGYAQRGCRFLSLGRERAALERRGDTLAMNGRAVFNFAATRVPEEVRGVLGTAGLCAGQVDRFLFHQGSAFILETVRKRLGLSAEQAPSGLADIGNTVSSSIPLLLEPLIDGPGPRRCLLCGFGVGLAVATCLLERID